MANPPNLDPAGLWREMLGQWERGLNGLANQASAAPEFTSAMHQVTAMSLKMQEATADMMEKSLKALNLPSRGDLMAVHERLGRIEAALERLAPAPAEAGSAAPPPRTRKAPG
jgi:SMC interacting uncharacterized protein involved in chromosome segregation